MNDVSKGYILYKFSCYSLTFTATVRIKSNKCNCVKCMNHISSAYIKANKLTADKGKTYMKFDFD